jgi:imidazoleglycerol-phosphate dehydratase / histidinol-phosphatase
MKVVFLDRDGTLIAEPADEQVDSLEKLEFLPGAIGGLARLRARGFALVLVSNQDHLGTPGFPQEAFDVVQGSFLRTLAGEGVRFDEIFICPHAPDADCSCRKPKTGLVDAYLRSRDIDATHAWMVGDRATDVEFANRIGFRPIRIGTGSPMNGEIVTPTLAEAFGAILRQDRSATVERATTETKILVDVCLDGTGTAKIRTGIGFFDHMLEQLAKHSGIDIHLAVDGDLHVDEHHTVEDAGLAIGEAIRRALGTKQGISRYGFAVPMDEARADAVLDLSGRPSFRLRATFRREKVGDLPTELVEDFFRAFADGLRANLQLRAEGRNEHHEIEALFKATARALRQAVAFDERSTGLPSTKGVL